MEKTKEIFSKIVQYIGVFGAIFVLLLTFSGDAAKSAEVSIFLSGITAVCIYAAFNIAFAKNKNFKRFTESKSSGLMFFMAVAVIIGLFIRTIAFMLLNVDIFGKRALICYIYSIVFYLIIYFMGRLCWSHKMGVASSIIYVVWCAFDVYPVVNFMSEGKSLIYLLSYCVGNVMIYSGVILALYAIRCNSFRKCGTTLFFSGVILTLSIFAVKHALIAILSLIIFFLIARDNLKYDGRYDNIKSKVPALKYILYFTAGIVVSVCVIALVAFCFGIGRYVPNWVLYLQNKSSIMGFVNAAESSISSMWSGIYFERNNFISYFFLVVYMFIAGAAAMGCRNAVKLSNSNVCFMVMFPVGITLSGLFENSASPIYIWNAMPCLIVLAGGGVSEVFSHVSMPYGGFVDNNKSSFKELSYAKRDVIKNKYALPDNWEKMQVTSFGDSEPIASDVEEILSVNSNERPASENVASGDELDGMLDNLFGTSEKKSDKNDKTATLFNDDADDNFDDIADDFDSDLDDFNDDIMEEKDGVVLFRK